INLWKHKERSLLRQEYFSTISRENKIVRFVSELPQIKCYRTGDRKGSLTQKQALPNTTSRRRGGFIGPQPKKEDTETTSLGDREAFAEGKRKLRVFRRWLCPFANAPGLVEVFFLPFKSFCFCLQKLV
ncbi:MAG: hypothetical protein PHV00_09735, partial [Syntrophales bacterium]|nr:hypothetical protein [Syntrophales bacterium]